MNTINKIIDMSSWVLGAIVMTVTGLIIGAFAVLGLIVGIWNPLVGFLLTTCGTITVLPLALGVAVGYFHSKAKEMLANFQSTIQNAMHLHDEPLPPTG